MFMYFEAIYCPSGILKLYIKNFWALMLHVFTEFKGLDFLNSDRTNIMYFGPPCDELP